MALCAGYEKKTRRVMSDIRKQLEKLTKELGLKTGSEFLREQSEQPQRLPIKPVENTEESPQDSESSPSSPVSGESAARGASFRRAAETIDTYRALRQRLGVRTGNQWVAEHEATEQRRQAGDFEVQRIVPGELTGGEDSQFFLSRHDYPIEYRQGIVELGTALSSVSEHIAFSACDPELEDFDPQKALFMDTETTGLSGGSGTVAFLVGVGYFTEDGFRLDQCFMRDYDDEEPMLRFLAERFRGAASVVGFNSKSFDLPLLRTRFIQNRVPFPLEGVPHFDLMHAARRFWKRRLSDCSLGNIEREVLGIHRNGDVPSFLIPQLWMDYLYSRDARPLEGVFYHHRMDILSLVSLVAWLSQCLDAPAGQGFAHREDRLSLVRLYYRQKQYDAVIEHGNAFLEAEAASPLRRECLEMLAMAHKRRQHWLEMQQAWELLIEEFPGDLNARLELAKHHEHRTKDLRAAERLLEGVPERDADDPLVVERLARIRRKLTKNWRGQDEFES